MASSYSSNTHSSSTGYGGAGGTSSLNSRFRGFGLAKRRSTAGIPPVEDRSPDQNASNTPSSGTNELSVSIAQSEASLHSAEELDGEPTPQTPLHTQTLPGPASINAYLQAITQSLIAPIQSLTSAIETARIPVLPTTTFVNNPGQRVLTNGEADSNYELSQSSSHRRWLILPPQDTAVTPEAFPVSAQPGHAVATVPILIRPPRHKRACYYLLSGLVIGIVASFVLALWWARTQGDISAGFTLGSYIVALDALVVAAAGIFHVPSCRCWKGGAKSYG
ncbi:hypothetical protein F4808DRAFT_262980 [Astrocystis sublimbata]|nr:hypothetical protein F4808DRAFT_262980 [Astrocystis sublimbata]